MKRRHPITEVMTEKVITADTSEPLSEVWHILQRQGIHHVPVVEGEVPVGMISSTDILRLVYDIEGSDDRMMSNILDHQFNIEDAMSTDLVTLPVDALVADAADVLSDGKHHSVLVVDSRGALEGIVTTTDLIRFLRDMV